MEFSSSTYDCLKVAAKTFSTGAVISSSLTQSLQTFLFLQSATQPGAIDHVKMESAQYEDKRTETRGGAVEYAAV